MYGSGRLGRVKFPGNAERLQTLVSLQKHRDGEFAKSDLRSAKHANRSKASLVMASASRTVLVTRSCAYQPKPAPAARVRAQFRARLMPLCYFHPGALFHCFLPPYKSSKNSGASSVCADSEIVAHSPVGTQEAASTQKRMLLNAKPPLRRCSTVISAWPASNCLVTITGRPCTIKRSLQETNGRY
jgi:hypothetical protein